MNTAAVLNHARRRLVTCLIVMSSVLWSSAALAADGRNVRHGYSESLYGELHYSISQPVDKKSDRVPVILFHQTSNSSVEFGNFIPELGKDRIAIGMDTPGYGNSQGPREIPTIENYADAMASSLIAMGYSQNKKVDLLGNKTGAFIAIELAIRHPQLVRRLVLVGVWAVPEETRLQAIAEIPKLNNSVEFFNYVVDSMPRWLASPSRKNLNDEDWGRVRVASLQATFRREHGHHAAYAYAGRVRDQLPKISQPVLLMIPGNEMREPTLEAMKYVKHATLSDMPDLKPEYYFNSAPEFAAPVRKFLDADPTR